MQTRGSGSASVQGGTPPAGAGAARAFRDRASHIGGKSFPGGGGSAPPYPLAAPRRTASAAVIATAPHSHTHAVHAHAHVQALVRVRSATDRYGDISTSGSMQRLCHTRSASASLLHQLQNAPQLDAHMHEAPMLTISFSNHTRHTTVHAGPVALSVSPALLGLAQRCVCLLYTSPSPRD